MKEYRLFVGGVWQRSDQVVDVYSPFTGERLGTTYLANASQIEAAIERASQVSPLMAELPSYRRAEILLKVAAGIRYRAEELVRLIASEVGKPIKTARIEVERAQQTFTIAAEESKRIEGQLLPVDIDTASENRLAIVRRFPIGVVSAITPFNFPLNLVAHKLAPAFAAGNTVILKPAPQAPLTAITLAEIFAEAGLPEGALSVVACQNDVASQLVTDQRVKMLSFTGSALVGWQLKKMAYDKRVLLELGGNAAVAIHSDADLDLAASRSVMGSFAYSGQVCISVQRIYVHQPVYEQFLEKFLWLTKELKTGSPLNEETDVAPMISEAEAMRIEGWVKQAVDGGAEVLLGGHRHGAFFEPTIIRDVDPKLPLCSKEAFAPVVVVGSYNSFDEALSLIDNSEYGLQAGIFTRDIEAIFKAYKKLSVGGLIVGDIPTYRVDNMPYGGMKQSGMGREGIKYAMEEMMEIKTLILRLNR